jgi:hypothetical protein
MRKFSTLSEYPFLKTLQGHEEMARHAQSIWQQVAPENLASLSQAQEMNNQQLKLTTPHNAVAAKIKMLAPSILNALKKQGYEVTAIQVKVQVKSTPPLKQKKTKEISPQAGKNLEDWAQKLAGTQLGDSLAKLAKKSS